MRGEDDLITCSCSSTEGSPPHARGRPFRRLSPQHVDRITPACAGRPFHRGVVLRGRRITPACAGKTFVVAANSHSEPDHPRMRGEDSVITSNATSPSGSPPHARGRPDRNVKRHSGQGITPACAGKTIFARAIWRLSRDHPRMRGEDDFRPRDMAVEPGSPPHARGRPEMVVRGARRHRITPACAGKTPFRRKRRRFLADHPRMRGEDLELVREVPCIPGSPPHARGRHPHVREVGGRPFRITPACAGKTSTSSEENGEGGDHPRMRGEDKRVKAPADADVGSPPHARGRPYGLPVDNVVPRITPACAGKTCASLREEKRGKDHPRMRGEDPASRS